MDIMAIFSILINIIEPNLIQLYLSKCTNPAMAIRGIPTRARSLFSFPDVKLKSYQFYQRFEWYC